jgi:hypothetical protein
MPAARHPGYRAENAADKRLKALYPDLYGAAAVDRAASHARYGPAPSHRWRVQGLEDGDILAALTLVPRTQRMLEMDEAALIAAARARGTSWDEINTALGYSTPGGAARRWRQLRAGRPGWHAPRPDGQQWARDHEAELRAAAAAVAGYRDDEAMTRMLTSARGALFDLEEFAAAGDPASLFWAAAAACEWFHRESQPDTPGMRALAALQDLVTDTAMKPKGQR